MMVLNVGLRIPRVRLAIRRAEAYDAEGEAQDQEGEAPDAEAEAQDLQGEAQDLEGTGQDPEIDCESLARRARGEAQDKLASYLGSNHIGSIQLNFGALGWGNPIRAP